MTYRIVCAGCDTVFRFRSMERIGLRVRQHRCETAPSHSVDHVGERSRELATIDAWSEVPSFASECEEAEYWATHGPSPALLEQFAPMATL